MEVVGAANGLPTPSIRPPPPGESMERGVDPKKTVMCGGDKEKAADYANCKSRVFAVAVESLL